MYTLILFICTELSVYYQGIIKGLLFCMKICVMWVYFFYFSCSTPNNQENWRNTFHIEEISGISSFSNFLHILIPSFLYVCSICFYPHFSSVIMPVSFATLIHFFSSIHFHHSLTNLSYVNGGYAKQGGGTDGELQREECDVPACAVIRPEWNTFSGILCARLGVHRF